MAKKTSDGFVKFAAGRKVYGGGRSMPNIGHSDKTGYNKRDRILAVAKRRAGKAN